MAENNRAQHAWDIYRTIEDYVYHILSDDEFKTRMQEYGIPTDVYDCLLRHLKVST